MLEEEFNEESPGYTEWLKKAVQEGWEEASKETMKRMGYNVVVIDGWVVKINEKGEIIEKISKIKTYEKKNN